MRAGKFILLPFVLVVTLCVFVISYFTYQDGKDIILHATERYYRFVLAEASQSIAQRVNKVLEIAEITAQGSSIRAVTITSADKTGFEQKLANASAVISKINAINAESSSIALINAQGKVLVDVEGVYSSLSLDAELDKVRSGENYAGVKILPEKRGAIIFGLAPIMHKGAFYGAVFISMNMKTFSEVWNLPVVSLSEVRLTVLNSQDLVIACSDQYFSEGENYAVTMETAALMHSVGELLPVNATGLRMGMRNVLPHFGWSIIISVSKSILLEPATHLLWSTAITSTIAGMIAIVCMFIVFNRMQARIRKGDDALERIVNAAAVAIWEWDGDARELRMNRYANVKLGYTDRESIYSDAWCIENMHNDDWKINLQDLTNPDCRKSSYSFEGRVRNSVGQWQWVRIIGTVCAWNSDGSIKRAMGIYLDIQQQKEREAERAEQRQKLEELVVERTAALQESSSIIQRERLLLDSVLNNIPDAIYYKDLENRYAGCNAAFERMTGFALKDIMGKTCAELNLFLSESARLCDEGDRQALLSSGPYWYEQLLFFKNGQVSLYETVKNIYRDEHGVVMGIVGVSRDITERRKAEDELVRTRQEANAANKAKSEFLANMSHEIRTPLNGIVGLNYLAMQENPPEKIAQYLGKIEISARNLALIINDILDFSKIEAGKLELDYCAFALRDIVQSTFDMLQPTVDKKGISLRVENLEKVPPALMGDSLRLSQVFLNLLSNGVKFTDRGSVSLIFEVEDACPTSVLLFIRVQDTGIGMTPEQLSRLFTAFTQADASTTRKYGGTGLGLTISKSIIEMMGGSLSVSSVPNEGSCFSFRIRLDLPTDSTNASRLDTDAVLNYTRSAQQRLGMGMVNGEKAAGSVAAQKQRLEGVRVLLAEDNEINQMIAQELLQSMGCRVDIANDGQEAVNKALGGDYALILMDIQMPVMDGFAATAALRKHPALDATPIIAMTAHALVSDREKSLAAGMQDHVTKPIDPQLLQETVLRWVQHSQ